MLGAALAFPYLFHHKLKYSPYLPKQISISSNPNLEYCLLKIVHLSLMYRVDDLHTDAFFVLYVGLLLSKSGRTQMNVKLSDIIFNIW